MKQQIINVFMRTQPELRHEVIEEALDGFGMNQHQIPSLVADIERRERVARLSGFGIGLVGGVLGVSLLTALVIGSFYLAGAM